MPDVGGDGAAGLLDMRPLQCRPRSRPGMNEKISHFMRLLVVAALTVLSQCATPSAHAVSPPPIDDRWLPEPKLPAPPRPTVQREVCAAPTPTPDPGRASTPPQLAALGLPQLSQLPPGAGQRVALIHTGVSPHRRPPQ